MSNLTGQQINQTYDGLLNLQDSTTGITSTYQQIQDGLGNNTGLSIKQNQLQGGGLFSSTYFVPQYMGTTSLTFAAGSQFAAGTQNIIQASPFYDSGIFSYSAMSYYVGTATSKVGGLALIGKDANGAQIDLAVQANGTGSTFTVDSSAFPGVPADRTSDAIASSVATSYNGTAGTDITKLGGNALSVTCGTSKAEKLTITAWGTDSAGARVKSNSVDFYCSDSVDKVTVSAAGTSVNVDVTDANGFPVADGTSVALAASNGSVVAPASKSTENGKFATAATFIANSTAATSSVTAIVGSKSGTSAAVKGSGTSIEAQIASMLKLINKIMKRLNIR
jgi:hypothetical protein